MELIKLKEKILKLDISPKNQTEFIENIEIILDSPKYFDISPNIICAGYNYAFLSYHVVIETNYNLFIIRYNFNDAFLSIIKISQKDILRYETFTDKYKIIFYYSDIDTMTNDGISFKNKENYYKLLRWFVKNNNYREN